MYNLIVNMITTLPYDNSELNIEYLIAKNHEVNTTSSMITVIFLFFSIVMYSLFERLLSNYNTRLIKLTRLVYLIDAVHNLNLELDDIDSLIECLEEQVVGHSESESDGGSDDDSSDDSQNETINLMVNLNNNSRRVLRSQTRKTSESNSLVIKGKGWKLD